MEQDTRKISASQLAEVLAKVDERATAKVPAYSPRQATATATVTATATEADERVSGAHERSAAAADAPPPSTAKPQVLAVVERPVGEGHVVNRTSPEAPASSGRLPVSGGSDSADDVNEASSARAIVVPQARALERSSGEVGESREISETARTGGTTSALFVAFLFVAGCVLLVLFDR